MMRWLLPLILCFAGAAAAQDFDNHVVQVVTFVQRPDFDSPWKKNEPTPAYHLGTLVGPRRILVSAHAVSNARSLEMSRVGDSRKYALKAAFVDYAANVALLEPEDPEALKGLTPLALGAPLKPGDQATLLSGTRGEKLVTVPLRLREVEVRRSGTSGLLMPHYYFEVRQTSGLGWSEPVIVNGRLVGIAVGQSSNTVFGLPLDILRHVLADAASPRYRGFGRLGLTVKPLTSPDLRAYLKAANDRRGVLVTEVAPNSPFLGLVQPHDVLLQIGDTPISETGSYQNPAWGRMHFIAKIADFYAGDKVRLKIQRQGVIQDISGELKRYDPKEDFVPDLHEGLDAHLIYGGLLFQELSKNFLESWGDEWLTNAPEQFVFLYSFRNKAQGGKRQIVLNRVLADDFSKGYEKMANQLLYEVNGVAVHSLDELREALKKPIEKPTGRFAVFQFTHGGGSIVLDYDGLKEAHERMAKHYNIYSDASFFTP